MWSLGACKSVCQCINQSIHLIHEEWGLFWQLILALPCVFVYVCVLRDEVGACSSSSRMKGPPTHTAVSTAFRRLVFARHDSRGMIRHDQPPSLSSPPSGWDPPWALSITNLKQHTHAHTHMLAKVYHTTNIFRRVLYVHNRTRTKTQKGKRLPPPSTVPHGFIYLPIRILIQISRQKHLITEIRSVYCKAFLNSLPTGRQNMDTHTLVHSTHSNSSAYLPDLLMYLCSRALTSS